MHKGLHRCSLGNVGWNKNGRIRELHSRTFQLGSFVQTLSVHIRRSSYMFPFATLLVVAFVPAGQRPTQESGKDGEWPGTTVNHCRFGTRTINLVACYSLFYSFPDVCWSKSPRGSAMMFSSKCRWEPQGRIKEIHSRL